MRSCVRVLKAIAVVGFVVVTIAPATACSVMAEEDAHRLTSGGANAKPPGSGTPDATTPGVTTPAAGTPDSGTLASGAIEAGAPPRPPGGPGCGLPSAAFCDTFDAPAGNGNRSGDLATAWGVSRTSGYIGTWATTPADQCGQTVTVNLKNDIKICNGHMVEASNDDTSVTTLAMYVKQPFDIAGRTGTVVFDVSDDSHGAHRAWPEFWYTDKPVPAPFIHQTSWNSVPKDGFQFELSGDCEANSGCGACPGSAPYRRVGFGGAKIIRNYVRDEIGMAFNDSRVTLFDCVAAPPDATQLNHFEVRIAQNQIEIYGTEPGTTTPLKKLVSIANVNLTLTRGLIWIEDAHYNGNKDGPDQGTHTFAWDNVGFDGPVLPADLAFDVLDEGTQSNASPSNGFPLMNLGWTVPAATTKTLTINGVTGIDNAAAGLLTLNFSTEPGVALTYSLNGNAPHVQPWVFPDTDGSSWRTIALPVPLSEVVPGTNTVSLSASGSANVTFANVDLIMVGAAGVK
jgi:hypothetical protein